MGKILTIRSALLDERIEDITAVTMKNAVF
jgi:hypothetical protein